MSSQIAEGERQLPPAATLVIPRDWQLHWNSVGARVDSSDHLRQVERTEAGVPTAPSRIDGLVDTVAGVLALSPDDALLDLCCGNGLVTRLLAAKCRSVIGVDFSAALIAVAQAEFAAGNIEYLLGRADDPAGVLGGRPSPRKICVNAGLQYFSRAMLATMLHGAATMTGGAAQIFCTDVPDIERLHRFYDTAERRAEFDRRRAAGTEAIGTWWDAGDMARIGRGLGYEVTIRPPEERRNTAHYRFDVLFTPG